jgi:hypothetical protein
MPPAAGPNFFAVILSCAFAQKGWQAAIAPKSRPAPVLRLGAGFAIKKFAAFSILGLF